MTYKTAHEPKLRPHSSCHIFNYNSGSSKGTRTPWRYKEPKQGVWNTKRFRDTSPKILNEVFLNVHRNSLEYDVPLSIVYW